MIFLPREGDMPADMASPEAELITMDAAQMTTDAYEITSPTAKELSDYRTILEKLDEATGPNDQAYLGVEWAKKRNCIVMVTDNIDEKIKHLSEKGISVKHEKIEQKLWEQTHQFITDRGEFEGIADIIVECVKGNDRFYIGFNWKKKRNAILWSTDDANDRGICTRDKGVAAVVRT